MTTTETTTRDETAARWAAMTRTEQIAHLRQLRERGAGQGELGTGPTNMLGHRPDRIIERINALEVEERREQRELDELLRWESDAMAKVATPVKVHAPRDVSGLDDVLVIRRGGNGQPIEIGNHIIRSGSCISPELWAEIGDQLQACVAGYEATIASRGLTPAVRAMQQWAEGAWLIRVRDGLEGATRQCPIGPEKIIEVIAGDPLQGNGATRLAWLWMQTTADGTPLHRALGAIVSRQALDARDLAAWWAARTDNKEAAE